MKLTNYGHACFSVQIKGKHILFDPFIKPNELAKDINVDEVPADYIIISHGHSDHIADCVSIAKRTGATVLCGFEVGEWLKKQGLENIHPVNTGGKKTFDFGSVKAVVAHHSGGLPDGSYGGNPMGYVVTSEEGDFYFAGDTSLTLDMQLIPSWANLQFSILPIGDNFTMDIDDAIIAAEFVKCDKVIGVHYNTFGFIKIDTQQAVDSFKAAGKTLLLPAIGETIDV